MMILPLGYTSDILYHDDIEEQDSGTLYRVINSQLYDMQYHTVCPLNSQQREIALQFTLEFTYVLLSTSIAPLSGWYWMS